MSKLRVKSPFYLIVIAAVAAILTLLVIGWIVMTSLDAINADWAVIPALGYGASLGVTLLAYTLGGVSRLAAPRK